MGSIVAIKTDANGSFVEISIILTKPHSQTFRGEKTPPSGVWSVWRGRGGYFGSFKMRGCFQASCGDQSHLVARPMAGPPY